MMIFLTTILIIVAFVIGVLVGRILKMSFGCSSQDNASQVTPEIKPPEIKPAASSTANVSGESISTESSANLTASDSNTVVEDQAKASRTKAKPKSISSKPKTASGAAKKMTASKTTTKTATTAAKSSSVAKKSAPAPKAKSKTISASKAATVRSVVASHTSDDLKLIKGVGKLNETRLNDQGVTTFAQVAAWKKADIAEFDEKLNFKGRIERDEWVPQAKALANSMSKTASSKPAAAKKAPAKKTTDAKQATIKTSVKKSAPKSAVAKKASVKKAAPKATAVKPSTPDDLKLIKGVGKLIETKLAKEGITTYSQIAVWKKADIIEFDEKLSFKGRIDRDDWIKQAKLLAKGGTTEFSNRAAKGQVPSSS